MVASQKDRPSHSIRDWSRYVPDGNKILDKMLILSRTHAERGCWLAAVYDTEGFMLNLGQCACECDDHGCMAFHPRYRCAGCKDTGFQKENGQAIACRQCHSDDELARIQYTKGNSGISWHEWNRCDLAALDATTQPRIGVESWLAAGMLMRVVTLHGGTGTGKTHAAIGIARSIVATGGSVFFREVGVLIEQLRHVYSDDNTDKTSLEQALHDPLTATCTILDDLGTQRSTAFADEQLFRIVNERTKQGKLLIVTSNYDREEALEKGVDRRIVSRIYGDHNALVIGTTGDDRRYEA